MLEYLEPADIWVLIIERGATPLVTEISFGEAPSRRDFLQIVRQTPWMSVWEEKLLPIVKKTKWPMPAGGFKANEIDLVDESGKKIGRLRIERRQVYKNQYNKQPRNQ